MNDKIKRRFGRFANYLWMFFATVTILLAIMVTIIKTILPQIKDYRQDLELQLSEQIGLPVLIGAIDADWKPLGPEIVINEVLVIDPNKNLGVISVRVARVKINAWRSLINMSPYATLIELDSAVVNLSRSPKGVIHLTGLDPKGSNSTKDKDGLTEEERKSLDDEIDYGEVTQTLLNHFLAQSQISVKDSRVVFTDNQAGGAMSTIAIQDVSVVNKTPSHQITAKVLLASAGVLNVVAEFDGDPREEETKTEIYLRASALDLAKLPIVRSHELNLLKSAKLNTEIWLNRSLGSWQSGFVNFSLDAIKYKNPEKQHLPIKQLAMSVQMRKVSESLWYFSSRDLQLSADNLRLPNTSWKLTVLKEADKTPELEWTLSKIPIEKMMKVVSGSPYIEPKIYKKLSELAIKGSIDNLRLTYNLNQSGDFDAVAEFSQLSYKPVDDVPSIGNLSGSVNFQKNKDVKFNLLSQDSELGFKSLFRQPIPVKKLEIEGNVQSDGETLVVDLPLVKLANEHTNINSRVNLRVTDNESTYLTLYSEIPFLDLSALPIYLPTEVMSELLVKHLDAGFKGGKIVNLRLASLGTLESFPYKDNNGYFGVMGDTDNTLYQFLPDWPAIEQLNSTISFVKDRLEVNLHSGQMLGMALVDAKAVIPTMDVKETEIILNIKNAARFEEFNKIIKARPLADGLGKAFDDIGISDIITIDLNVQAGLGDKDHTHVNGEIQFVGQNLEYKPINISAEKLEGKIAFTENSVESKALSGMLYDEPAKLEIKSTQNNAGMKLDIGIRSAILAKHLKNHVAGPWETFVDGKIPIDLKVAIQTVRNGASKIITTLKSNLQGVALFLPGKFAKEKKQRRSLAVEIATHDKFFDVHIDYDKKLQTVVRFDDTLPENEDRFYGAKFQFGREMNWNIEPGLSVGGELASLQIEDWVEYFKELEKRLGDDAGEDKSLTIEPIKVRIGELKASEFVFKNVDIDLAIKPDEDLAIGIVNPDIAGKISILKKDDTSILVADFERFILREMPEFKNKGQSEFTPDDLLPMLIECAYCEFFNKPFGQLSISGQNTKLGYEIEGDAAIKELLQLKINGAWIIDGGVDLTSMRGTMTSNNLGNLHDLWKIPGGGVRNSELKGNFNLFWPNKPHEINLAQLGGSISVELGQGHLEDISDAGARVFSLLSLSSIPRRLSLDFSDLFSKGFFYDSIKGEFYIENGWAKTDKALVNGAAADVEITGASDLVEEKYDQRILVKPKIGSSLPLLAGWAVNPTIGATVFLLNEIFEPLEVVTSIEYQIVGSWENPEIIKVGSNVDKVDVEAIKKKNKKNN